LMLATIEKKYPFMQKAGKLEFSTNFVIFVNLGCS
jgi:hypothetical protein